MDSRTKLRFWFMSRFPTILSKKFLKILAISASSDIISLFSTKVIFSFDFSSFEKREETLFQNFSLSLAALLSRY